jgi:hypothetical protein
MRISWRNLFWKLLTFLISEIDAFSLFHTVKYKNHSVGYIFHSVGYKSHTVKQRILPYVL